MLDPWKLEYQGFNPEQEALREALCTLGNGYFASRGAHEESRADDSHYPGTYMSGGYNRLISTVAGHDVSNEDLVNWPNWLPLNFRIAGGDWLNLFAMEILDYRQTLDMRGGTLQRSLTVRDGEGRETLVESQRFVSMRHAATAGIRYSMTALNWSGDMEIYSGLDGSIINSGVERYRSLNSKHLRVLDRGTADADDNTLYLLVETSQSHIRAAQVVKHCLYLDGDAIHAGSELREEQERIARIFRVALQQGQKATVEKILSFVSSRLPAVSNCLEDALQQSKRAGDFAQQLGEHQLAWEQLWSRYDIDLNHGNAELQQQLRLHIFHLLQTVSMNSVALDSGVPARGLHGEAYRGHIFWDSMFILPFYNLRIPQVSRALLMYRYRRLDEARWNAREKGLAGAQFPWQSASSGREETQQLHLNPKSGQWDPDHSHLQYHVGLAIAYNIWQYYQSTGDDDFMNVYGAEMFLEIAHFWASLCRYNSEQDRYEIHGVVGPDEYHEKYPDTDEPGLRNNAYSNIMAAWVLERALAVVNMRTPERRQNLLQKLGISDSEIQQWDRISRRLQVSITADGIIEQFEGYTDLEELDWDAYRKKYGDIQRLDRILKAERDSPDRYQISKQADLLMLFFLFSNEQLQHLFARLGYAVDSDDLQRNIDYYYLRTCHGSTLSHLVHASVLHHRNPDAAWRQFCQVMASDISDIQGGTTSEGIHLGAMAGGIDILLRHYAGVSIQDDGLVIAPQLPEQLSRICLKVRYRGPLYTLIIDRENISLRIDTLKTQTLLVDGREMTLQPCTDLTLPASSRIVIPNGVTPPNPGPCELPSLQRAGG